MWKSQIIVELLESVKQVTGEVREDKNFDANGNNYDLLSEKGKYVMGVFRQFNRLSDVYSDLSKVEIFLRRFPASKFYRENDINQLSYVQYHIEVFIHKVHTILDLQKIMVNEIYELGFSEKKCTWENISKREDMNGTKVLTILNSYFKTFNQVIQARHLNTHRGIFKDEKKDDIAINLDIYEGYRKLGIEIDDEFKRMIPRFVIDWQVKNYRNDRLKLVKSYIEIINQHIELFLNEVYPEFKKRKELKRHTTQRKAIMPPSD